MPSSGLIPDEECARQLLTEHLARQGESGFRCVLNSCDRPDLLVTWDDGRQWGVEVIRTYLQVADPRDLLARRRTAGQSRPRRWSSANTIEPLRTFGKQLGEATRNIRKRDYTLSVGPSSADSLSGRPTDFGKQWKKDTKKAILEHIQDDRTDILRRPGVWLKPSGSGNRWTVAPHPGVQEIKVASLAMLNVALKEKVEDLPTWNGNVARRWLLLLNHYPLAPSVSEVETALKQLISRARIVVEIDGIFWNGYSDSSLVSVPMSRRVST